MLCAMPYSYGGATPSHGKQYALRQMGFFEQEYPSLRHSFTHKALLAISLHFQLSSLLSACSLLKWRALILLHVPGSSRGLECVQCYHY